MQLLMFNCELTIKVVCNSELVGASKNRYSFLINHK